MSFINDSKRDLSNLNLFQITPGQKITEVISRDHETSLISPTTEAEGAWKLVKEFHKITLFNFCKSPYFIILLGTLSSLMCYLQSHTIFM